MCVCGERGVLNMPRKIQMAIDQAIGGKALRNKVEGGPEVVGFRFCVLLYTSYCGLNFL